MPWGGVEVVYYCGMVDKYGVADGYYMLDREETIMPGGANQSAVYP